MTKLLIIFSFPILFLLACKPEKDYASYSIYGNNYEDKIESYLYKDSTIIDSASYETIFHLVDGLNPHQYFFVDTSKKGWSCEVYDSIIMFQNKYLNNIFLSENKFLNRIISDEKLTISDSIQILEFWSQLFTHIGLIVSSDSIWKETVNLFYDKFVFEEDPEFKNGFSLDICEKEMYVSIYDQLFSVKPNIYYATTWKPYFLDEGSIRKYIFLIYKIEMIEEKEDLRVEISFGDYINFR